MLTQFFVTPNCGVVLLLILLDHRGLFVCDFEEVFWEILAVHLSAFQHLIKEQIVVHSLGGCSCNLRKVKLDKSEAATLVGLFGSHQ